MHQLLNKFKSFCRAIQSLVETIFFASLWSSAKRELNDDVKTFGSLFMKIKNNKGPSIDPCGIPDVGVMASDLVLPIITN